MLKHLNHAKELGTQLTEFATAFHLNVNDLYDGKAELQRKGFWPAKSAKAAKPELLAVQVSDLTAAAAARRTGTLCAGWCDRQICRNELPRHRPPRCSLSERQRCLAP